jgi:hypothetical protein
MGPHEPLVTVSPPKGAMIACLSLGVPPAASDPPLGGAQGRVPGGIQSREARGEVISPGYSLV